MRRAQIGAAEPAWRLCGLARWLRMGRLPLISVVVPVLDEEAVLREFHRRLTESLARIAGPYEIVYVDDGSTDGSSALIDEWANLDACVVAVRLARTFGMDVAMSAGLDYAEGAYVVLIHADLQDPPELIPEMLEIARKRSTSSTAGGSDGTRVGSSEWSPRRSTPP